MHIKVQQFFSNINLDSVVGSKDPHNEAELDVFSFVASVYVLVNFLFFLLILSLMCIISDL